QARTIAQKLARLNITVSVADHFGFLRHWEVIGPFDGKEMTGFRIAYPPETDSAVKETEGKGGAKVAWKPLQGKRPPPPASGHGAVVNLHEMYGDVFDAVAYARTTIRIDRGGDYELRGAADDNFTIWVNGKRAFAHEEYRNGVRFDRHRIKVQLQDGVNTILVKVCQAPLDPTNPEPNWEFLLRLVDAGGRGVLSKPVEAGP